MGTRVVPRGSWTSIGVGPLSSPAMMACAPGGFVSIRIVTTDDAGSAEGVASAVAVGDVAADGSIATDAAGITAGSRDGSLARDAASAAATPAVPTKATPTVQPARQPRGRCQLSANRGLSMYEPVSVADSRCPRTDG